MCHNLLFSYLLHGKGTILLSICQKIKRFFLCSMYKKGLLGLLF